MSKKSSPYSIPVYRLKLVRDGSVESPAILNPPALAFHLREIATADREHMVCIHLNTKNQPIGRQTISIGTLNATLVSPREVFKAAILANAFAIVLAHNHPSGSVNPSQDDHAITKQIAEAGKLLGIHLLDHVILGPENQMYSFQENYPAMFKE